MDSVLKKYTSEIVEKAKRTRALVFDVDGVLTDGSIIYTNSGDELKKFNVKDGQIIKHLKNNEIIVGAITGRSSQLVQRRCEELKLDFFYQGVKDKHACMQEILEKHNLIYDQVAYIGDDIIDLKVISESGLGVCPIDAMEYVKVEADLISSLPGGKGVVREVGDLILASKGLLKEVVQSYLI